MSSRSFACAAALALGTALAPAARAQFQFPNAPDPVAAVKAELLRIDLDALKDAYRQAAQALVGARRGDSDQEREFFVGLERRKAKLRAEILRMTQELADLSVQKASSEGDQGKSKSFPESRVPEGDSELLLAPEQLLAEPHPKVKLLEGSPEAQTPKGPPEMNLTPVDPDLQSKPSQDEFKPAPSDPEEAPSPEQSQPSSELDELRSRIRALEEENNRLKDLQSAQSRLKTLEEENAYLKAPQPDPAAEGLKPIRPSQEGTTVPQSVEDQSVPILPTSDQAKPDAGPQNQEPTILEPAARAVSPTSAKEPGLPLPTIADATPLPPPAAPEAPKAEAGSQLDEISRKLDRLIELLTRDREPAPIAPTAIVPH